MGGSSMNHSYETLRERHAEWAALPYVSGTSFTDCVRGAGLDVEKAVKPANVVFKVQHLYQAWPKFEKSDTYAGGGFADCWLAGVTDAAANLFVDWLLAGKHQPRYTILATSDEVTWLRDVARLVAMRRIMEKKHEQRQFGGFQDQTVAKEMAIILATRHRISDFERETAHALKAAVLNLKAAVAEHEDAAMLQARIDEDIQAIAAEMREYIHRDHLDEIQHRVQIQMDTLPPLIAPPTWLLQAPQQVGVAQ